MQQAGGRDVLEYWIPAEELDEFNAQHRRPHRGWWPSIRGPAGPTLDFGRPAGCSWRAYLQGESWLCRGWVSDNTYVQLYHPRRDRRAESVEWADTHPGIAILGDDGGRERLAVDLRLDDPPVVPVDVTNVGWADAIEQAESVTAFVGAIEGGSFTFRR